jgi:hypothetical protein
MDPEADPIVLAAWLGEEGTVRGMMKAKELPAEVISAAFLAASEQGHQKLVDVMFTCKADVNSQYAATGLVKFFIGQQEALDVVPMFIRRGLHPMSRAAGEVFEYACDKGKAAGLKTCGLLLSKGLRPNEQFGVKGLQLAAQGGHDKIVHAILDAKADVTSENGGLSLRAACLMGQYKVVTMLIAAGADASSHVGNEALHAAVSIGNQSIVKLLIASQSDPSSGLPVAAFRGNETFIKLLLEARADAKSKQKALKEAARFGHQSILTLLYDSGVQLVSKEGVAALRLSHAMANAESRKPEQKIEVVRSLQNQGARWSLPAMTMRPMSYTSSGCFSIAPPTATDLAMNAPSEVVGPRWYSASGRLQRTNSAPSLRKVPQTTDCRICSEYKRCQLPATHPPYKTYREFQRYNVDKEEETLLGNQLLFKVVQQRKAT